QHLFVLAQTKATGFDTYVIASHGKIGSGVEQFLRRHRIPMDAVEESQQPWSPRFERWLLLVVAPDLERASHELVPTGALHSVDAQVRTADPHGALGRPRPRRVVLRRHQAVARIDRRGERSPQIHVTQPEDEVRGVEDDLTYFFDTRQTVDPPDEFNVPGT